MSPLQALGVMLAFGSILFLAYITTRLIANKSKRAMRGKYINIVESVNLGMDKQIHLLKIDREFVLIATSGKTVEFLSKINISDFDIDIDKEVEINSSSFDFKGIFEKYIKAYKGKKSAEAQSVGAADSRFYSSDVNTLKNNLSRLKSLNAALLGKDKEDGVDFTNEK